MFDMGADKEHIDRGPGLPGSGREDYLGFGRERGSRWFRAGLGRHTAILPEYVERLKIDENIPVNLSIMNFCTRKCRW